MALVKANAIKGAKTFFLPFSRWREQDFHEGKFIGVIA
jgi:hypothetical protein